VAVIVGGHAQARDRAQKILGIDVGADLAGGCRGLEKRSKGGSDSLLEMRAQGFEGRVSRMQGRGEPAFGGNKRGVSLHPTWPSTLGKPQPGVRTACSIAFPASALTLIRGARLRAAGPGTLDRRAPRRCRLAADARSPLMRRRGRLSTARTRRHKWLGPRRSISVNRSRERRG